LYNDTGPVIAGSPQGDEASPTYGRLCENSLYVA
jgi:hypothetical protein